MTLQLVSDQGERIKIGGLGVADELRDLADRIDAGEYEGIGSAIVIIDSDVGVTRELLGKEMSGYDLVGILEQVKFWTIFNHE